MISNSRDMTALVGSFMSDSGSMVPVVLVPVLIGPLVPGLSICGPEDWG